MVTNLFPNNKTKTGVQELKEQTIEYYHFVEEINLAVPFEDRKLKTDLLKMCIAMTDLLTTLGDYN